MTNCYSCGSELVSVSEAREVRIGKRSAVVLEEFHRCAACGEEFYAPGKMDEAQRRAATVIREREGLLQPEEIRAIRERLGLTQDEFERLIGAGPKTVVRWERGTVFQNSTTDTLIRIIRDVPEAAQRLGVERGVTLGTSNQHTPEDRWSRVRQAEPEWRDLEAFLDADEGGSEVDVALTEAA